MFIQGDAAAEDITDVTKHGVGTKRIRNTYVNTGTFYINYIVIYSKPHFNHRILPLLEL